MNSTRKGQRGQDSKPTQERVYGDSNLFIYAAIGSGVVGNRAREILKRTRAGEYKLYTSTLTVDEFLWRVQKEVGRELASKAVEVFFSLPHLTLISVDTPVVLQAISVYSADKRDPRDAIHVACMRAESLTTVFSADPDFDHVAGVKRIDFSDSRADTAQGNVA